MIYNGSKNKIAHHLLPYITKYLTDDKWYVEPFAGGFNMMDKLATVPKKWGNDINKYIIAMFKYLVDGYEFPHDADRDMYKKCQKIFYKDIPCAEEQQALTGWVGAITTWYGQLYSGYCAIAQKRANAVKSLLCQKEKLNGVRFSCMSYDEMDIPAGSIIYCDPPYANTDQYRKTGKFDSDGFWEWCRGKTEEGNHVLVSEYVAPKDFCCVCSVPYYTQIRDNIKQKEERLFVHESLEQLYRMPDLFSF